MTLAVYHFTVGAHLRAIARARRLAPARAGSPSSTEVPCLWVTTKGDTPEGTATKGLADPSVPGGVRWLSVRETHDRCGGIYRLTLSPAEFPYRWEDWARVARVPSPHVRAMRQTAIRRGSFVGDFRFTVEPVGLSSVTAVARWAPESHDWAPLDLDWAALAAAVGDL